MDSRPNDELERTQVMKIDDEKERGRPSPRPGTGLVEETITARRDEIDVMASRKGGREHPGTCTAGPEAKERRQDVHSSHGSRAEDQRPWWRTWWGRHQKRNANAYTASSAT